MPPPITKGSICEIPFIRCLYIFEAAFSVSGDSFPFSSAMSISFPGLYMPSAEDALTTFFPSNLSVSIFVSAASMTALADLISSSVSTSAMPLEPLVSIFMFMPLFLASDASFSAAMYV